MSNPLLQARNALDEAKWQLEFLSSALCTRGGTDEPMELGAPGITGLYYVLGDIIQRLQKADELLKERDSERRRTIGD